MLRDKAVAIITALSKEKHHEIPDPIDPSRFRQKYRASDLGGRSAELNGSSSLVPVHASGPGGRQYEDYGVSPAEISSVQRAVQM